MFYQGLKRTERMPTTHLHLLPRSRMVELYFQCPIRVHGTMLNEAQSSCTFSNIYGYCAFYLWPFNGARGSVVVEELCYKPEDRRFKARWCGWISWICLILPAALGTGIHSAPNRNEYQKHKKYFWGVQRGRCVRLTSPAAVKWLSRQCGVLCISQTYRPPRPLTEVALLYFTSQRKHWMGNWNGYGRKWSWPILIHCSRILLEDSKSCGKLSLRIFMPRTKFKYGSGRTEAMTVIDRANFPCTTNKTNSLTHSPQANYTDWTTAIFRRNCSTNFCGLRRVAWSARPISYGR
jgi:hypothetical protein